MNNQYSLKCTDKDLNSWIVVFVKTAGKRACYELERSGQINNLSSNDYETVNKQLNKEHVVLYVFALSPVPSQFSTRLLEYVSVKMSYFKMTMSTE